MQVRRWNRSSSWRTSWERTQTRNDTRNDRSVNYTKIFRWVSLQVSQSSGETMLRWDNLQVRQSISEPMLRWYNLQLSKSSGETILKWANLWRLCFQLTWFSDVHLHVSRLFSPLLEDNQCCVTRIHKLFFFAVTKNNDSKNCSGLWLYHHDTHCESSPCLSDYQLSDQANQHKLWYHR